MNLACNTFARIVVIYFQVENVVELKLRVALPLTQNSFFSTNLSRVLTLLPLKTFKESWPN